MLLCLCLVLIAAIGFGVSESMASRFSQTAAGRTDCPLSPNVGPSDLLAGVR